MIIVVLFGTLVISSVVTGVFDEPKPGMFQTMGRSVRLMDLPDTMLIVPPLHNVKVGKITLNDQDFYLVLGQDGSGRDVITFDCNNNLNLTDDSSGNLLLSYESRMVKLITNALVHYGADVLPYYICILWNTKNGSVVYFGLTRREGALVVEGEVFHAAIAETDSDGVYNKENVLLMVDLNRNGRFEEHEVSPRIFQISGRFYEVDEVAKNGSSVVLRETEDKILTPVLGEKLVIPELSLTDMEGKPVDLESDEWKLLYFEPLYREKSEQTLTLLKELSQIEGFRKIVILALLEEGCCQDSENTFFEQLKKIEGLRVVTLNMERALPVMEKLSLISPETFMIISPEDKLCRTPVAIATDQLIWKAVAMPLENPKMFLEALSSSL